MKHTFILQEVINDIVETEKGISSALLKLNYFSKLINNSELEKYTRNELNGYEYKKEEVPDYRVTRGTLNIVLQANIHKHKATLPFSMLEEPYKSEFPKFYIMEGIAAIETMAKTYQNGEETQDLVRTLPMELLHIFQEPAQKLYKSDARISVINAVISANPNIIVEIPNAIRTRLLDFVMNIGKEFGFNIEIEKFNEKSTVNNQTINNFMNTNITNSGDGNIINTGSNNELQNNVTLYKGDFDRLKDELKKQGIEEADIIELAEIVNSEEPNYEEKRLGEKSNGWITNILNKSLNGVGKISSGVSANLLATLIKQFYGME